QRPLRSTLSPYTTLFRSDLGTWGSLYDKLEKDENQNAVVNARTLLEDASGNMTRTQKDKVVVVDGLKDYIIVDKEEVLLIYPKSDRKSTRLNSSHVKISY